ncbi:hypothetical protein [Asaia bogorensis]|uniref:hypothetical protein n=1 Tax=Asaia bogorensis TaxID=91915 RepID=UPI0028655A91|nr:hypothetical protein [Asaia bogorensis]MDR6182003.1 hypothetical protein [Asaia bogorensis NBRC 16594]
MKHERVTVWNDQIILEFDFIKGARDVLARAADRLEALAKDDQDWEVLRELEEQQFMLGKRCDEREAAQ